MADAEPRSGVYLAQTNLQLFSQITERGYQASERRLIQSAYGLGARLFPNRFRGTGKPFVCHLVGTASALVCVDAPGEVVAAGLLHAAYEQGDFGDRKRGVTRKRRRVLKREIGRSVEELVAAYSDFEWNVPAVERVHSDLDSLTEAQRKVLLIQIANELDECWDLGMTYCPKPEQFAALQQPTFKLILEMARGLDAGVIADQLEYWVRTNEEAVVPDGFEPGKTGSSYSLPVGFRS